MPLDLPKVLKQMRLDSGLSQKQISDAMGKATRLSYSRYELGYQDPTIGKLEEIISAMGYKLELVITKK